MARLPFFGQPIDPMLACADKVDASTGSITRNSASSGKGGLTTMMPEPASGPVGSRAPIVSSARSSFGSPSAPDASPSASGARALLERIPQHIDAGRPLAVRGRERAREPRELVRVLERRIDQHQAAALLRRHIGGKRRPAVDRYRLGAPVAAQRGGKRRRGLRLELAGDEAVLRTHQGAGEQRGARIGREPAGRVERGDCVEIGREQRLRAAFRSGSSHSRLMPLRHSPLRLGCGADRS